MKRLAPVLAIACLTWPAVSRAAEERWDGGFDLKPKRRSGFAAGLDLGFGLGNARGYPNDISKIDDPLYRSSTGDAFGSTWSLWLGGALRDWFTFGIGLMSSGEASGEMRGGASALIFHVEGFPLWSLGGPLRDLAIYGNFGAGGSQITGGREDANGGLMSVVGGGVNYELFRFGHFALGPMLETQYLFSQSAKQFGVFAGARTTFYGGP